MKKLILILGPNGVGKTTTAKILLQKLSKCAYVDADWCRAMNPFPFTDATKYAVTQNIYSLFKNFQSAENAFLSLSGTYFRVFLTWWTMQRWYSVFGNAAAIASLIPLRPSAQMIRISFTPRFFSSFSTDGQYLELSLSPTLMDSTSFRPSVLVPRMT